MTTLTCDHCESEIDVEIDPKCAMYWNGSTDVMCAECRERAYQKWQESRLEDWPVDTERLREAFRIKRGWRA